MKVAIAALVLSAAAFAAPFGAAQAASGAVISVETRDFGIRIGTPVPIYAPVPVYAPPVVVPAPVVVAPPVVYAPPRVVVAPVAYPVLQPYRYAGPPKHLKHRHRHGRHDIVYVGHPRGRY